MREEDFITRTEADRDHQRIHERLDKVVQTQSEIQGQLREWEASAAIVRWVAVTTIGLTTAITGLLQWIKKD